MWVWWGIATAAGGLPHAEGLPQLEAGRAPMVRADAGGRVPAFVLVPTGDRMVAARALEPLGIDVSRDATGRLRGTAGALTVRGSAASLRRAEGAGWRVVPALRADPEFVPPPTDVTAARVQADALWQGGSRPNRGFTGAGVTIANIDSGIDVYHPHFFRADAGVYAWVDVDGDGELTPGVDGVDLDGSGDIGSGELLQLLEGFAFRYDFDVADWIYDHLDGALDPERDWLFVDENEDGRRNFGRAEGFGRAAPAFGEPLFVADDADGNGFIERPERLLRLGSSIIRTIWTPEQVFQRDGNLLQYVPAGEASHGTAVSGILAGGQLPLQRVGMGLAPDADLVIMDRNEASMADIADFIDWAGSDEGGVDVVLHEYAPWWGYTLDGTHPIEQLVARQVEDGSVVHVCPVGNLADAAKHTVVTPDAGQLELTFDVTPGRPAPTVWMDLHVPAVDGTIACDIRMPDGQVLQTGFDDFDGASPLFLSGWRTVTTSPTVLHQLVLWNDEGDPLADGRYTVTCDTATDASVHAYLTDGYGWSRGVGFTFPVRANTMGMPSTSSACLAVGAIAGRFADYAGELHEIRSWSSRGPRPDGLRTLDLVAPDDPFAPASALDYGEFFHSGFERFGGTSGASPHVAAVAALVWSAEPRATADEVRQAVLDAVAPRPEPLDDAGLGELRAWRAVFDSPVTPPPEPVEVQVRTRARDLPDGSCAVEVYGVAEGHEDAAFRWDLNYDGTWDVRWSDRLVLPSRAPFLVRVEAEVAGFRLGGAAVEVDADPRAVCTYERRGCGCAGGGVGAPGGPGGLGLGLSVLVYAVSRARRRASARQRTSGMATS